MDHLGIQTLILHGVEVAGSSIRHQYEAVWKVIGVHIMFEGTGDA